MKNDLCARLGIEVPIFAFTHCRDVVVAVSKAGGLGVLGAVGFTPEQLEEELNWIDAHIGDKPYAVDIVIPQKYEGIGETDPDKLEAQLNAAVPQGHRDFAAKLLEEHGVPEAPADDKLGLLGWTEATARPLLDAALKRDRCVMIANALGTPPKEIIDEIQASGRLVGALCGKVKQAKKHQAAGVDVIIAQGTEGGGHTGEIGSIVLWPQIIDAVAPTLAHRRRRLDRLALAHRRGGRGGSGREGPVFPRLERGYGPLAFVHRQALPNAQERLDGGLGSARYPGPARHAPPGAGHRGLHQAHQSLPECR